MCDSRYALLIFAEHFLESQTSFSPSSWVKPGKPLAYKIILRGVKYPNSSQIISSINKKQSTTKITRHRPSQTSFSPSSWVKPGKPLAYKIILRGVEYPNTPQIISSVNKNQPTTTITRPRPSPTLSWIRSGKTTACKLF